MLNAYYFRQQMYSLVPRHVREDMQWMADIGTGSVSLAILEQDLSAARRNVEIICAEAERVGMKVWAVPSRWGGLVAGAPKVPSHFAAAHPETWALQSDGSPRLTEAGGPVCSVHHPATSEFFAQITTQMLAQWPLGGIIWDEPKCVGDLDFCPAARQTLGDDIAPAAQISAYAGFFDQIGKAARAAAPEVQLALFIPASHPQSEAAFFAATPHLDYFGCDGRPWGLNDGGQLESKGKTLLDNGPAFIETAHRHGKRSLFLLENHNMPRADYDLMDKRLPEVLKLGADHLIYYYFPRNLEEPERAMEIVARHLRNR